MAMAQQNLDDILSSGDSSGGIYGAAPTPATSKPTSSMGKGKKKMGFPMKKKKKSK